MIIALHKQRLQGSAVIQYKLKRLPKEPLLIIFFTAKISFV